MKNIMRAISLGLVCAIATSNVAQAGIFSTFKNAYEKTKDVACKYGPTLIGVPAVAFLFAATYRMGRAEGAVSVSERILSRTQPKLCDVWRTWQYGKYEKELPERIDSLLVSCEKEAAFKRAASGKISVTDAQAYASKLETSINAYKPEIARFASFEAHWNVGSKMRDDLNDALKEVHLANEEKQRVEDHTCLNTTLMAGAGLFTAYLLEKERIKNEERKNINVQKA